MIQYEYDGLGNRIEEHSVIGEVYRDTFFAYDVNGLLARVLEESNNEGSYEYLYGNRLLSRYGPDGQIFYHQDQLGSSMVMSSVYGEILFECDYDVFGAPRTAPGTIYNPMQFTGEYTDPFGLINLRARVYDPTTGRFLTQDSYLGDVTDPLSQNPYAYCGNNPVYYVDPSGHLKACDPTPPDQFNGLRGASLQEIRARVPAGIPDTFRPSKILPDGFKYQWITSEGIEWEVYGHCPKANAPQGSNDANGWTFRVIQKGTADDGTLIEYYLSEDDNWYINDPQNGQDAFRMNETHIPMKDPNIVTASGGTVEQGIPPFTQLDDAGNMYNTNGDVIGQYDYEYNNSFVWGPYMPGLVLPGVSDTLPSSDLAPTSSPSIRFPSFKLAPVVP